MKLHKDKDAFETLLSQINKETNIRLDVLEKDYYVTLMLEELAEKQTTLKAYFKGGTALYKALKNIRRFSEDIDLTVDIIGLSNTQKSKAPKKAAKEFTVLPIGEDLRNQRGSVETEYLYTPLFDFDKNDTLDRYGKVKVEAETFTVNEPVENMEITPAIYEYASNEFKTILENKYEVKPFTVKTIKLERIFIDKVFAAEFYYERVEQDKPEHYFDLSKHLYDISVLIDNERIKSLLEDQDQIDYLVDLKRKEELARSGGVNPELNIKDFKYFNNLNELPNFEREFKRMQNIYVFNEQDEIAIEELKTKLELLYEKL